MRKPRRLTAETLEPRCLLAADPVISEFVASNDSSFEDGFGNDSDWIEIHNAGDEFVDLQGYHLTDTPDNPAKWTFNRSTVLPPDGYLVVFASSQDTVDPLGFEHVNFKLSAGGEYVALVSPDNVVLSEFGANGTEYPPQITDVSFGRSGNVLLDGQSTVKYLIPANGTLGTTWTGVGFDATGSGFQFARAAMGYEASPGSDTSYAPYIETVLPEGTSSVYVRHEFDLPDASEVTDLNLNLKYDDGVAVYLNGQLVDMDRTPANLQWNSTATSDHDDANAIAGVDFPLGSHLNLLQDGSNVIALHLLNVGSGSSDLLLVPELRAEGLVTTSVGYLTTPTPGTGNSTILAQGPIIREVEHSPEVAVAGQPILVTAEITPYDQPIDASSVRLTYRHMYGAETTVTMVDDGSGVDAVAGDGIHSAQIPGSHVGTAEMTRWYITANTADGLQSRSPRFIDPLDSAEYYGTVAPDAAASDDLPVVYWFVENEAAASTRAGTRASIEILGEFYDNVQVDGHGQSTAGADFPKKSFDFDSNRGQKFRTQEDVIRASDFNLLTNYGDQTKLRHPLAYEAHREAGVATLYAFSVEVHRNGSFYGLFDIVEEGDEEFLERLGLDPTNSLYKVNNPLTSAFTEVEQKAGTDPTRSDFQEVVNAESLGGTAGRIWDYDHLDLADMANYFATNIVIQNLDFGHKNMYWYRDTSGTGLWSVLPWDVDLSFGHVWNSNELYFDNEMITNGPIFALNDLFDRMYNEPRFKQMFERRVRTLMDQFLGPAGSNTDNSWLGQQVIDRTALVADEAQADYNLWGVHPNFTHTPASAAQQLLDVFLPGRRSYLEGLNRIPDPHGDSSNITIETIEHMPASGDLDQQFVQISNHENFAVDISGWTMTGAIDHVFKPGTVIPANQSLYLTVNVPSFQSRASGPGSGQQLFIQSGNGAHLDPVMGSLQLQNTSGTVISQAGYAPNADFNGDNVLDCDDINLLTSVVAAGSFLTSFDLNSDATVDLADVYVWLQVAGNENIGPGRSYLPGDANLDRVVDVSDFNIWNTNRFESTTDWCLGNFNADNTVDVSDFIIWNSNKFAESRPASTTPAGFTADASPVVVMAAPTVSHPVQTVEPTVYGIGGPEMPAAAQPVAPVDLAIWRSETPVTATSRSPFRPIAIDSDFSVRRPERRIDRETATLDWLWAEEWL